MVLNCSHPIPGVSCQGPKQLENENVFDEFLWFLWKKQKGRLSRVLITKIYSSDNIYHLYFLKMVFRWFQFKTMKTITDDSPRGVKNEEIQQWRQARSRPGEKNTLSICRGLISLVAPLLVRYIVGDGRAWGCGGQRHTPWRQPPRRQPQAQGRPNQTTEFWAPWPRWGGASPADSAYFRSCYEPLLCFRLRRCSLGLEVRVNIQACPQFQTATQMVSHFSQNGNATSAGYEHSSISKPPGCPIQAWNYSTHKHTHDGSQNPKLCAIGYFIWTVYFDGTIP